MSRGRNPAARTLLTMIVLLVAIRAFSSPDSNEVLTNASDILALPSQRAAESIKVSIAGVVTAAEPNWKGRFFVQDASGGVFVDNAGKPGPSPGDLVSVSGVTTPGGYAPCIHNPQWKKLGTSPLPKAKVPTIDQFTEGTEDSQRIEMSGVVRSAFTNFDRLGVELVADAYRFDAYSPIPGNIDPKTLVGARVRVRGTAAVAFNADLRHFQMIVIYAPFASDFIVVEPAAANPFEEPLTPLNGIAQYRHDGSPSARIHVKGIVTYQRPGEDVFLRDNTGGLQVKSPQMNRFSVGDTIEAVGFPGVENFLPVLEDAVLRKTSEPRTSVVPFHPRVGDLQNGKTNASFITLTARLLDLGKGFSATGHGFGTAKTVLVLQTTNLNASSPSPEKERLVFTAESEGADEDSPLMSIPIGSLVEVSGICLLQGGEDDKKTQSVQFKSLQLLLPSSESVRVLAEPSWLVRHLKITLLLSLVVILVGSTWIVMISRKNTVLRSLIHERELDRKELQKAHDTLEWRVKERTKQLKVEITARKEADLQAKAILSERTRLAKELHDTIEQTMTGVTLQLDAVSKMLPEKPETATHHLGLARNMVRASRVDLRRSIWNLRSRELEQFDLPSALLVSGSQIVDGTNIRIEAETKGTVQPLPETLEENILRIGQEAITNTVKHAGASRLTLELEFSPENVVLTVKDDGNGFTPGNCLGPDQGHFGLLGMSERAKRLDGTISITSAPGAGTTIRVEIPIGEASLARETDKPEFDKKSPDYEEIIADTDCHS